MPPFETPRTLAEAALLDIAVAETFRGETIRAAYDSAKNSANAYTAAAKKLTVEARKLENAADDCLLEAMAHKKAAKWYYHQLQKSTNNPLVKVDSAASDAKTELQRKAS